MEKDKIVFKGSHPDSLYRVQVGSETGADKMARVLRLLRWPLALIAVCVALAVFVYFLMPDNIVSEVDTANGTYWEPATAGAHNHGSHGALRPPGHKHHTHTRKPESTHTSGTKTPEIDFYDAESDKDIDLTSIMNTMTETIPHRVLPIIPVFPSHITPEVQYGNEKADADKLRTPKVLEEASTLPDDSTLKPHITQKPEKPLAVYFKDLNEATITTETITRAETVNEFANFGEKQTTKKVEISTKLRPAAFKEHHTNKKPLNLKQYLINEPEISPYVQELYAPQENIKVNFTSGHSNLFGISIEDAEKMRSTTQSSLYNTRVSPTLPTWRDGDDTTTKKYPVSVNYEVPQCRSTRLPLCREVLPYDLAGSPATIGGVEVTSLMSQIEYLVATNCSERVRHFTCALLEPECNPPPYPPKMPCYNLCKAIVDSCDGMIPRKLAAAFDCKQYSHTNCVAAKAPCFERELTCGDGSCIPRDWICDGTKDCPGGEDEAVCHLCDSNEFRCNNGGCILKRWLCDGYADCPGAEDEAEGCERHETSEPGEESAGSAPAPAVRRPNKEPVIRGRQLHKSGENDNSQELLVTSDSSNAFKRNFTRRPSPSRLVPYTRSTTTAVNLLPNMKHFEPTKNVENKKRESIGTTQFPQENRDSMEDINIGDLGFFEEFKKTEQGQATDGSERKPLARQKPNGRAPPPVPRTNPSKLDKSINKLEKVINGAALLQKAQVADQELDSPETNATTIETNDDLPLNAPMAMISSRAPNYQRPPAGQRHPAGQGSTSAHVSPCPSGELRCVDGRCITLAQLCDGTIDCTDHADEDNCFT